MSQAKPRGHQFYHQFLLPNGRMTDGFHPALKTCEDVKLPDSLEDRVCWDIGCADWGVSIEMLRRGAKFVCATDVDTYLGHDVIRSEYPNLIPEDRFTFWTGDVSHPLWTDLPTDKPLRWEPPDLVVFAGVLYHLANPYQALENIGRIMPAGSKLLLETHGTKVLIADRYSTRPLMEFLPEGALNADPSNWWAPTPPAIEAMLERAGFESIECVTEYEVEYPAGGKGYRFAYHATRRDDG